MQVSWNSPLPGQVANLADMIIDNSKVIAKLRDHFLVYLTREVKWVTGIMLSLMTKRRIWLTVESCNTLERVSYTWSLKEGECRGNEKVHHQGEALSQEKCCPFCEEFYLSVLDKSKPLPDRQESYRKYVLIQEGHIHSHATTL